MKLVFDHLVPPLLDLGINLLIQVADRSWADLCAPQGVHDIFDPTDRTPARYIPISASSTEASRRR